MADVAIQQWSTPASLDSVMDAAKGGLEKERTLRRKSMRINSKRASHSTVGDVFQFYDTLSSLYFPDASSTESREDPLTFFDETFFFLDHLERNPRVPSPPPPLIPPLSIALRSPSPTPSTSIASAIIAKEAKMSPFGSKIKPRQNNGYGNRVSFASMLSNCHDHRMSTIMETASTTVVLETGPNHIDYPSLISTGRVAPSPTLPHRRQRQHPQKQKHSQKQKQKEQQIKRPKSQPFPSRIYSSTSTSSSTIPTSSPSTNMIKRLVLEYIKPYPTIPAQPPRRWKTGVQTTTTTTTKVLPIIPSIRTPSLKSKSSEKGKHIDLREKQSSKQQPETRAVEGDEDEDWVIHGFFEIHRKDSSASIA